MDKALYNFARRGVMPQMGGGYYRGGLTVDSVGRLSANNCGRDFYVAGNFGVAGNDGSSWDKAMLTLAEAITANNTLVALNSHGWASRNRIFITGDLFDETLVAFPNKCDVIGVGSYDANSKPGIQGNHAPINASTVANNMGTRWINCWFQGEAVASPIVTLTTFNSGIQFLDCTFDAALGTVTSGITATASPFLKVLGCDFFGSFATNYIALGAGQAAGTLIANNDMHGSAGIGVGALTTTTGAYDIIIRDNFIQATGQCIDDDSDLAYIINNTMVTKATIANAAGVTSGIDANSYRSARNNITGGTGVNVNYPIIIVA